MSQDNAAEYNVVDGTDYGNSPGSHSFVKLINAQGHTDIIRYDAFVAYLFKLLMDQTQDILHAAVGISGEAGELLDAVKKTWIYNKPLDRANVIEELGDLRFYIQAMMNVLRISEQEILQSNANKLAVRYKGLVYTDEAAQKRADKAPGE